MYSLKTVCLLLLFCSIGLLVGCFESDNLPDISHIDIDFEGINYDDEFLAMTSGDNIKSSIEVLKSKFPALTNIYINNVMRFRHPRDTSDIYLDDINGFLASDAVTGLKHRIDSVYTDRSIMDRGFEEAFRYMKYYLPERSTPRVYYMMTEYSVASFIFPESETQDGLGISLDMFMGRDYPYKKLFPTNPSFSDYLTPSFDKAYVVKKGMDAITDDIVGQPQGPRMIDQMILNGKKQYILEQFLPTTPDTILWEYTAAQMDWVTANELNLYSHFTSQEMLYSTDHMAFMKFVNPSPNSPGLPAEAPGRTANYIGYKIIQAYMRRTGASIADLIGETDSQNILNAARYKPSI